MYYKDSLETPKETITLTMYCPIVYDSFTKETARWAARDRKDTWITGEGLTLVGWEEVQVTFEVI